MSAYSILSQRRYLFTDVRHIHCGELEWYSPDGNLLPLTAPPEPPVDAHAKTGFVPHGVRLTCHPAGKPEISAREGEPVVVQFKLRSAELFGFEWT